MIQKMPHTPEKRAPFSLLMATFRGENPHFLDSSLKSMGAQTLLPAETIFVEDGPLTPALEAVLKKYRQPLRIRSISLEKNVGFGRALQAGLPECQHDIVARMDTDDIAQPNRFERQWNYLKDHPEIDVVGSWISEFSEDPKKIYAFRKLPTDSSSLKNFAKKRNPVNHMTAMYRKKAVLEAGNYQHFVGFADYYTWARMLVKGARFANLPEYLVNARAGRSMLKRRGGLAYIKNELELQKRFYEMGLTNSYQRLINSLIRPALHLLPINLKYFVYRNLLRKRAQTIDGLSTISHHTLNSYNSTIS